MKIIIVIIFWAISPSPTYSILKHNYNKVYLFGIFSFIIESEKDRIQKDHKAIGSNIIFFKEILM